MIQAGYHDEDALRGEPAAKSGVYVYGIVTAATPLPRDLPSVGDDETEVHLVSHGQVAAVISDLNLNRPLGTKEDLLVHERVLDTIAADSAVLPIRFGAVVADADAVATELLEPHHDHFASELGELAGLVQFTVRGRYVGDVHLREVLAEEPGVMELREALRGMPENAGYSERVRLGELVNQGVVRKRQVDTEVLVEALSRNVVAVAPHDVTGEDAAVNAAFLVDRKQLSQFDEAVDAIGQQWAGRIHLHLLGPLAPYDFLPER